MKNAVVSKPAAAAKPAAPKSFLPAPTPLAPVGGKIQPVDWFFAFKFNAVNFPTKSLGFTSGIFGGTPQQYSEGLSLEYVFATSQNPTLAPGPGLIGASTSDPLGATFGQIYNTPGYNYVLWNDQFIPPKDFSAPWGHSKGMLAWNDAGAGFVLQVTTPAWPGSGSIAHPRTGPSCYSPPKPSVDGNTLGCIVDDDIMFSQHFFALKITADDLPLVLQALANASVVIANLPPGENPNARVAVPSAKALEVVNLTSGCPAAIRTLVNSLGQQSTSAACTVATLSSGIQLISKPANLAVPPWQLVSAKLNGLPLRVANWWEPPAIYSTTAATKIACSDPSLGQPGPVQIATSGVWNGTVLGLYGGYPGANFNHAKLGVSMDPKRPLAIFGDMNQQGALGPGYSYVGQKCSSSQNGRGGTFYVMNNPGLFASLTRLLAGTSASTTPPPPAASEEADMHQPWPPPVSATQATTPQPAKKTAERKPESK